MDKDNKDINDDNEFFDELPDIVNIGSDTPIKVDEFTLSDIFDSDLIKSGINALTTFFDQTIKNDKANIELAKIKEENKLKMLEFDVKFKKIENIQQKNENEHLKWFDIRNKIFSIAMLVIIIIATMFLKKFDIFGKDEAKIIIIMALTIGMTGNTDLIKSIFNKKKE